MTSVNDLMPFVSTIGGGFFIGLPTGYAIKKIIKIAAVIVGLFIAVLAYFEYQRIIDVNWAKIQTVSQNDLGRIANTIIQISNNIGAGNTGTLSNLRFPLSLLDEFKNCRPKE
jgi:uncharacterized membrane protein (Fun14 family)